MKYEFLVTGMTCGGCVKSIEKAVGRADPRAKTQVDLTTKRVSIESQFPQEHWLKVIREAGFEPVSTQAQG
jgi:copper chaperone